MCCGTFFNKLAANVVLPSWPLRKGLLVGLGVFTKSRCCNSEDVAPSDNNWSEKALDDQ